jgi:hypothetical protein
MLQSARRVASGVRTLSEPIAEFATVHPVNVDGNLSMTEVPLRAVVVSGALSFIGGGLPADRRSLFEFGPVIEPCALPATCRTGPSRFAGRGRV